MSRWRPPREKSSPYITPQGQVKLKARLESLWSKRREVNAALAAAAAEGDRSENAEYIYRKKEQAGIDAQIRYLQKRIPDLVVVDRVGNLGQVFFGAWVDLEVGGREARYRIVGADETDGDQGWISVDSPLARALLGKSIGDEVQLKLGGETKVYEIVEIGYNNQTN